MDVDSCISPFDGPPVDGAATPRGIRHDSAAATSIRPAPAPNAAAYDNVSASRPATSGPMIAPMSAHIEKTATAVPLRLPAASPTAAAGAVPRKAEAMPNRQS